MAVETTPLGFQKPDGNEDVRNGDNVIAANAQKAEDRHQEDRGRLNLIEAKNSAQDGRLDGVESKNTAQDGRLTSIEAKDTAQDAALADLPNQFVPLSRGSLAPGTDWNTLTGPQHVGTYSVSGSYPNAPSFSGTGTLVVERGGSSSNYLSVVHRLTAGTLLLWREAVDASAGTWSAWSQADTVSRADAANAVQDGRLTTVEGVAASAVQRADPLAPIAGPLADDYAEVVLDPAGRVSEATFNDGTKYLPHAKVDTLSVGLEGTTASVAPVGYVYVEADAAGRIAFGVQDDGTVYAPNLAVETLTIGGIPNTRSTYVVPILGQSNALWKWYSASTVKVRDVNPRVKVWNAGTGTADVVPVTHGESLGLAFVMEFARLNPNAVVVAVPTALGSSGFTPNVNGTWDYASSATPNLYANALTQTKAALAATGGTLLAMLWSQGENDRGLMTEAQYDTALDAMIAKYRTDVGVADLPVIIGSMTPEEIANVAGSAPIAAAHVDTPRRVIRTAYVGGPKDYGLYGEQIHYSQEGNAVRGHLFATEGLYRARLNVTGKNPIAPNSLTIARSGTTATITWNAPPCRFTAFNLETSTHSGATWTAQTLTGPIATTHALTGLTAAAPLWARISTTNETGTSAKTLEVKA